VSGIEMAPVWLTLKLATVTTVLLLLVATPMAWWLAGTKSRSKPIFEALVALPLVLPPTVLGFYLLVLLGPAGPIGSFIEAVGGPRLVFTFAGLVFASVLYSLPFVVQPLQNAFEAIGSAPLEVAATLGANARDRFFSIVLPLARPGFITAATLGFAHTLGEFGVVLMIGGNIPGKTQVLSVAIYDHVEVMEYGQAHILSAGLLISSFTVLLLVYMLNRRSRSKRHGNTL